MKQLSIYCSAELSDQVGRVLRRQRIDSFVHMPGSYRSRISEQGSMVPGAARGAKQKKGGPQRSALFLESYQTSG